MFVRFFDPYSGSVSGMYIETTKKMICRPIIITILTNFFVVKDTIHLPDGVCHVLNPRHHPDQTLPDALYGSESSDFYARYVWNFAPDYLDGMLKPVEKQRLLEVLQNDILHLTTEQSGELVEVFERLCEIL